MGVGFMDSGDDFLFRRDPSGTLLGRKKLTNGSRHYYLADALGSTVAMTDANGSIAQSYEYEPYGALESSSGNLSSNPFKYAGGHDTGQGVYHFGARHYDPQLARWTQQDPLDQIGDLRQANRYGYVGGDPVNITDPTGTAWDTWGLTLAPKKPKKAVSSCAGGAIEGVGLDLVGRKILTGRFTSPRAGLVASGLGCGAGVAKNVYSTREY